MSSPQVDWFSQNAPTDPIQAAMGKKPIPKTDDWFAANSPAIGPNDPNGNYDFGAFGKVKGARMNGHVATRAEAFHSMDTINGLAQSMAQSVQQHQQAFEDLRKSFTTDQMTKDVMADLAGIAVAGGASKLAGLGRWTALAPQLEKSALGETVQTAAKPTSRDWFAENAPGIGPGTAHVTDPAFEGRRFAPHVDYLNSPDAEGITGMDIANYNTFQQHAAEMSKVLKPESFQHWLDNPPMEDVSKINQIRGMISTYRNDPTFRRIADASRHYVHNNVTMTEGSRRALGMDPLPKAKNVYNADFDTYRIDPNTTLFDGSKETRGDLPGEMSWEDVRKMAEDMHTAIREAPEADRALIRGIEIDQGSPAEKTFMNLKAGDNIDLPLSSFSTDGKVAADFTRGDKPVYLVMDGPSKHINVQPFNSFDEKEFVTQGGFQVSKVERFSPPPKYRWEMRPTSFTTPTGQPMYHLVKFTGEGDIVSGWNGTQVEMQAIKDRAEQQVSPEELHIHIKQKTYF